MIEPKIMPLVNALNQLSSVKTEHSCQGHIHRLSSPYVSFQSTETQATTIHQTALQLWQQGKLHTRWALQGAFNSKNQFSYCLYAVRYQRDKCQYWCVRVWYFGVMRHQVDEDIQTLSNHLNQLKKRG